MTTTAIIITSICVIAAAIYSVILFKSKEPDLDADALGELSVDKEWWNAN